MKTSRTIVAIALIVVGLSWMMWNFDLIDLSWIRHIQFNKIIWPGIVIAIGVNLLLTAKKVDNNPDNSSKNNEQNNA